MSVAALIRRLVWLVLTGRVRLGDVVVREMLGTGGLGAVCHYKAIYFVEPIRRPEYPDPQPDPEALHHRIFVAGAPGAPVRLVRLE